MVCEISVFSEYQQYWGPLGTDTEYGERGGLGRHSSLQTACYHLRVTGKLKAILQMMPHAVEYIIPPRAILICHLQ